MSVTIQAAWEYGRSQLNSSSPTPQLDARLLLEYVLDASYSHLIAHGQETIATDAWRHYQQLVRQARQHEPIPYLIGSTPFFDFDLAVTMAVLIPRPETEELVEKARSYARRLAAPRIVDVGTGSGCIAIGLAHFLPEAHITAVDISPDALAVARQNASRYAPQRIDFRHGSLLEPIAPPVDLLVANLPYVTTEEWTALGDGVKLFEPRLALDGGPDGLELIRQLLQQATTKMAPAGVLLLEIGWQQGEAVQTIANRLFPKAAVRVESDLTGRERFLVIEL
ncbi:MAG: peptide chain release factor N(5)-glutamine methyltransferase [Chloroflexota bacterium]